MRIIPTTTVRKDSFPALHIATRRVESCCEKQNFGTVENLIIIRYSDGTMCNAFLISHNSIGDEEEIHKWDLICWMDEEDSLSNLNLNDLKFAVVVGKFKDSRLKVLAEVTHGEDSENTTVMRDVTPSNDLDELVLNSKPSLLHRDKVCFVIGKITKFERSRLQGRLI